jgi:hypothetical protein
MLIVTSALGRIQMAPRNEIGDAERHPERQPETEKEGQDHEDQDEARLPVPQQGA